MDSKTPTEPEQDEAESLENPSTEAESAEQPSTDPAADSGSSLDATKDTPETYKQPAGPKHARKGIKGLLDRVNIYLLLMVALLLLAVGVVILSYMVSKKNSGIATVPTQNLSASMLQQ